MCAIIISDAELSHIDCSQKWNSKLLLALKQTIGPWTLILTYIFQINFRLKVIWISFLRNKNVKDKQIAPVLKY